MEIPAVVYHGTFWPEVKEPESQLITDGYISTSESYDWAHYFALIKRWSYRSHPGLLVVYQIETNRLPIEVIRSCIPPDGIDPEAIGTVGFLELEKSMLQERMKIREWRFLHIPLEAVIRIDQELLPADLGLSLWHVGLAHPH